MSWKGSDSYKVMHTGFSTGDLSAYTKIRATITSITGDNDYIQLKVVSEGKSDQLINLVEGVNHIVFASYDINLNNVTEISLWGTGSSDGSAVITEMYLFCPTISITEAKSFGDEITDISYITSGNKFVIGDGSNAIYFTGNQDSKSGALKAIPSDSYYFYTLTKIDGLDTDNDGNTEDDNYAINIVNGAGTAFPAPYSLGNNLNVTSGDGIFSGSAQSDKAKGYGTDGQYWGLWKITYSDGNGFVIKNVGRGKYLNSNGKNQDASCYLKLYKTINFDVTNIPDFEKVDNAADDAIFALANATGYNAETGVMTNGTWTFGTPVDISDWDYLMITTVDNAAGVSHEITITDDNGVSVGGEGYSGSTAGTGGNMWLDTWNNQNAIRISIDYLRLNKVMDITKIKSLRINGTTKIANVYLTDYNNTKINGGYADGDLKREYTATGNYGTICLPYKASYAGAEVYGIEGKTAGSLVLTKVNGLLEAGKAYFYVSASEVGKYNGGTSSDVRNVNFFRADLDTYDAATPVAAEDNNGLTGTFSATTAPIGSYILSNKKLYEVDGSVNVAANKAWVDMTEVPSIATAKGNIYIDFDESTGINTIDGSKSLEKGSEFFDLQGRRVVQPAKGLYILNGRKVVIK